MKADLQVWNNWLAPDLPEFIWFSLGVQQNGEAFQLIAGVLGFGFVVSIG